MSKRTVWSVVLIAAFAWGATACGEDDADEAEDAVRDAATTVQSRLEGATRLKATLIGTAEVPGPGDPDGTGTANVNIDVSKTEVCYEVSVQRIDRPTGMHIHEGEAGKSGGIVVPFTTPRASDTTTTGCTNVDATLLGRLAARPGDFYVNVHTDTHPQGAIRGQLSQ
jgi:hypothetical protein